MRKTVIAIALMIATGSINAALVNGSILNIGEGSFFTVGGASVLLAPGFDGQFITGNQGLILGTVQMPTGSHSGVPDGSESPMIDNPWFYLGNTGMSGTQSASNVLTASNNTATVDLSGWYVAWNGIENPEDLFEAGQEFSSGAWFGSTVDGVAQVTCGFDCGDGDSYSLLYSATSYLASCLNCGPTQYLLSLTGTISAVPVPAAVWLFGSGLIGLAGFMFRHKAV